MNKRDECLERIKAAEREFQVAAFALGDLGVQLRVRPKLLEPHGLRLRDFLRLRANLEATFVIRLFAVFEAGLRDAWCYAFGRTTDPPMKDLVSAYVGLCSVPHEWAAHVHAIREYRNGLVHHRIGSAEAIPIGEVRRRLCQFFSRLPLTW